MLTPEGVMSGREYLLKQAQELGLEVELVSKGDRNMHYVFKGEGFEHDAKGLEKAAVWFDGFRTASRLEAKEVRPVRAPRKPRPSRAKPKAEPVLEAEPVAS